MVEDVDTATLWEKVDRGDDLVLVDARSTMSWAASRLPGAISIPAGTVDERAPGRIPDRDAEIVVYCGGGSCEASMAVAGRLAEHGYANVRHYVGGKDEWEAAGLPLEGGRA